MVSEWARGSGESQGEADLADVVVGQGVDPLAPAVEWLVETVRTRWTLAAPAVTAATGRASPGRTSGAPRRTSGAPRRASGATASGSHRGSGRPPTRRPPPPAPARGRRRECDPMLPPVSF